MGEDFSLEKAVEDFAQNYAESLPNKIKNYLKKVWLKSLSFKKK